MLDSRGLAQLSTLMWTYRWMKTSKTTKRKHNTEMPPPNQRDPGVLSFS